MTMRSFSSLATAKLHFTAGGRPTRSRSMSQRRVRIISRHRAAGANFLLLGIEFDCKVLMHDAVRECVAECGWRLRALRSTRRVRTDAELVHLYKAHVL
eukprot:14299497-Alexandrium_andersonii.AAC.1